MSGRLLTVKEFSNATGQKENTIRQHIKRGKVLKRDDGFIDCDSDINKIYIAEVTKGAGLYGAIVRTEVVKPKEPAPVDPNVKARFDLETRKKQAEAEKIETELELSKMKLEKQAGNVLPVSLVESLFTSTFQSVFKNFEGEAENMAAIICGNDRSRLALVTKSLREVIGKTIEKAQEDSTQQIDSIIEGFREERGRGERR